MKLFKALVGLAAAASVIPLKVEKVEEDGKKTVRISSLTWKAEYTSATPEDDATLNVDLMGGLRELVKKKEKPEEGEEEILESDVAEGEEGAEAAESSDVQEGEETSDYDLADRVSGGGIRWVDLEESAAESAEEEQESVEEAEESAEAVEEDPDSVEQNLSELVENSDELMCDVVDTVVNFGKASTSMIQRKFKIGYGRAAKMIDALTSSKVISSPDGSKAREVLITLEQWNKIKVKIGKATPVATEAENATETE